MELVYSITEQIVTFDFLNAFHSKVLGTTAHANKKKTIGFQINGIGNGHLTQAKTLYDILINHYEIPVVLVYGRENTNGIRFDASEIIYRPFSSTPESTNNGDVIAMLTDLISSKHTFKYEESHQINFWVNLLVADMGNFRTTQLVVANQFSTENLKMAVPIFFSQSTCNTKFVSIMKPSMITPHIIPPLINTSEMSQRTKVEPRRILCYSVSGEEFPRTLQFLARKYKDFTFDYFLNYTHPYHMSANIQVHPTSKITFQEYQRKAAAVLCTSGHELIQECLYMGIPVASIPCSSSQEEQVENFAYYTGRGWSVPMTNELDLKELVERNVSTQQKEFRTLIDGREAKVLELIEKC